MKEKTNFIYTKYIYTYINTANFSGEVCERDGWQALATHKFADSGGDNMSTSAAGSQQTHTHRRRRGREWGEGTEQYKQQAGQLRGEFKARAQKQATL